MRPGDIALARSRSLYPERRDEKVGALDFALTQAAARLASRLERHAARLAPRVRLVDELAPLFAEIADDELTEQARVLRGPLLRHGFRPDLVARSFALTREAAWRKLGLRHHAVQIQGGWALLEGRLAEMQTGEGKTITALLAAVAAGLAGRAVHVVTVNDYLAARDAEELGPVYRLLGLSVDAIQHGQDPAARAAAYACDIAYAPNKEIAFDYLRDGLSLGVRQTYAEMMMNRFHGDEAAPLLLRGLDFAIVDEADSVLIDEARTPLIIAGAGEDEGETEAYQRALAIARQLEPGSDFRISGNARNVDITPAGSASVQRLSEGIGGLWQARKARDEFIGNALAALHLYKPDQHYVVAEGKIQIIDEFTGRIAEGRSWQHGLHQLIEAKENCAITQRNVTRASITYQRFFRRYLHLCGMSGTVSEVAAEVTAVYGTAIARIPTHRPSRRSDGGFRCFRTAEEKWAAAVDSVRRQCATGRPVLIGTRSIETSELLSRLLMDAGIAHVVLNARHDAEEAEIVAQAGGESRVTVATNMAGRGTDIKLAPGIGARGGLHVILTEFHESGRIDRQLVGRGGRQGEPGSFEILASLEDELVQAFLPRSLRRLAASFVHGEGRALPETLARTIRRLVQDRAQRQQYGIRRRTMRLQSELDSSLAFARPE